jgi:exopolysaccharide biosynthesis polyprenyl glycosylphosphotransferase
MNLSRREQYSIQALQLTDALVVFVSFWLAVAGRNWLYEVLPHQSLLGRFFRLPQAPLRGIGDVAALLYLVVPFTPLVLEGFGFYEGRYRKSLIRSLSQILKSLAVITLVVSVVAVALRFPDTSRPVLFFGVVISVFFLLLRDRVAAVVRQWRVSDEERRLPLVLAGAGENVGAYWEAADDDTRHRWRIAAQFDLTNESPDQLEALLKEHAVHRVVFVPEGVSFDRLTQAVELCELQGVEAWIAASFVQARIAQPTFDYMGDRAMLVLRSTPALSWALFAKEILDRVAAFVLIAFTLPIWLLAALGIMLNSPGPVFFRQQRGGRYGKPYTMWKFRTMVADAEAKLAAVKATIGNQMNGPVFKLEEDPRIFKFGRWLRKFSIDELPQLLNVLAGDMSLVGPRPLPLYEVEAIEKSEQRRRMSVKPGITCLWQVKGRNQITSFEDWVRLDLEYIDNWSLWFDLKILLKTIPAVLLGFGAK